MQLATVQYGSTTCAAVRVEGGYVPLEATSVSELLRSSGWRAAAREMLNSGMGRLSEDSVQVRMPLPSPAKVICCGLNYSEHILETGRQLPEYPTLFVKYADTLTDPTAEIISAYSEKVDWEAELAVVVGERIHQATVEEARQAIAGYTVANDISMRDWQNRTLQWFQGKAFDRTTPVGPVMVTADALNPEAGVDVICRINGEEVQRGNTSTLVFSCAQLLSYISTFTSLSPGDLILTGTPGGVGMGMKPPRFLADQDVVETEVQGIGVLRNQVFMTVSGRTTPA